MGLRERTPFDPSPTRLVIHNCGMAMDGGTLTLTATDEADREVCITLASTWPGSSNRVAGRLYFDGELVPMRSEQEMDILKLLTAASFEASKRPPVPSYDAAKGDDIMQFVQRTSEENCRAAVREILEAVQSESYLRLMTDKEKELVAEASRDDWGRSSGKKKRRAWRQ